MKKFIFSILIASFAIHAIATTKGKLPAILIDTLYMSAGSLVVEYVVLRPFDRISLSVQCSWETVTKDVKPVLLSGSSGKGKTYVPVDLIIDQAIHLRGLLKTTFSWHRFFQHHFFEVSIFRSFFFNFA